MWHKFIASIEVAKKYMSSTLIFRLILLAVSLVMIPVEASVEDAWPKFIQPMIPKINARLPKAQTASPNVSSSLTNKPVVIIIIDDIGDNYRLGKRATDLPVAVNLAFLPRTPFAAKLANRGFKNGHDIMLHLPMESTTRKDLLRDEALTQDLTTQELEQKFLQNLAEIPHVQGFNNHMGSLLTAMPDQMNWLMTVAAEQDLYFVDSRTTAKSVALQQATSKGIAALGRDVFLDPVGDQVSVENQLTRGLQIAQRKGMVIMIGHPYQNTMEVLERLLPNYRDQFQFLTVSDYLGQQKLLAQNSSTTGNKHQ